MTTGRINQVARDARATADPRKRRRKAHTPGIRHQAPKHAHRTNPHTRKGTERTRRRCSPNTRDTVPKEPSPELVRYTAHETSENDARAHCLPGATGTEAPDTAKRHIKQPLRRAITNAQRRKRITTAHRTRPQAAPHRAHARRPCIQARSGGATEHRLCGRHVRPLLPQRREEPNAPRRLVTRTSGSVAQRETIPSSTRRATNHADPSKDRRRR